MITEGSSLILSNTICVLIFSTSGRFLNFSIISVESPWSCIDLSIFVDEEDQNLDGRSYITCGFDVCTLYKDDNYALIASNNRKHQRLYDLKDDFEWNKNIANKNPEICNDAFNKIKLDARCDLPLISRFEFESLKDWYLQKSINGN
jgi:hypothetical protein